MKATRALLLSPAFTPARWFRGGEQGAWFDPSDITTVFQDAAGTTRAVANDPVGLILDKSGRGNHASQATAGLRPTLKQDAAGYYYLEFTDHVLTTAAIDLSGTDKLTLAACVRKASDAATACLVEGALGGAAVTFSVFAPLGAANNYSVRTTDALGIDELTLTTFTAPLTNVLSFSINRALSGAANVIDPRVNGRVPSSAANSDAATTGNFTSAVYHIGRRDGSTLPFVGSVYGLVICGATKTDTERGRADRWLAARAGVNL